MQRRWTQVTRARVRLFLVSRHCYAAARWSAAEVRLLWARACALKGPGRAPPGSGGWCFRARRGTAHSLRHNVMMASCYFKD